MPHHLLDGAFARVRRADEHFSELKAKLREFSDSQNQASLVEFNHEFLGDSYKPVFYIATDEAPFLFGILVGEIVYNLRAALDYLIYALAAHDSGSIQRGTQFPIEDTEHGFKKRCDAKRTSGVFLRGVSSTHVAQIEILQPYKGCNWTRLLRHISNPDKHRHLTVIHPQLLGMQVEMAFGDKPADWINGSSVRIHSTVEPGTGDEMHVKYYVARYVAFDDGTTVEHALLNLKRLVAETLETFKSEF